jgi:hypothetical protein
VKEKLKQLLIAQILIHPPPSQYFSTPGRHQKVFWKTLKGQVPLRLIKLKSLRETEQVHTPSASAR